MKTKPIGLLLVLCMLAGCVQEDFFSDRGEEEKEETFFEYAGDELAVKDILTALKGKNDSAHFVSRYLEEYGQPVWDKAKILPTQGETMVAFPVKKPGSSEIETIWFFIASGNWMTYFPFTKRVLPHLDAGADVEWMFDYFTQQVYPHEKYDTRYERNEEHAIVTKGGIWIEYCVNYSITVEFEGGSTTKKGTHCWTEYYYLADNIPTIDHVESPIAGGHGQQVWINNQGSWAGVEPPDIRPTSEQEKERNLNAIYDSGSDLDDPQKEDLKNALGELTDNPSFRDLLQNMIDKKIKLKFSINPALNKESPACYIPASHSIAFRTPEDIKSYYLEEELIHAMQHSIYGSNFIPSIKNFEFEAKVLRDLLNQKLGFLESFIGNYNQSESFQKKYSDFIKMVSSNAGGFTKAHLLIFYALLKEWTGYKGKVDETILPLLLLNYYI